MLFIPDFPESQRPKSGTLYVVATPIGNLLDMTLRALGILSGVSVIAAEDTRHTGQLLSHFHITTPLVSCHDFNEEYRSESLLIRLKKGDSVALVSDAGTPSISDPGYRLVCRAIEHGISVVPVPGPSAAMAALCVSGLATDRFVFIGFPSRKKKRLAEQLQELKRETRTMIYYESPRRVTDLLKDMKDVFGDRDAVVARELTKVHEEFIRGRLSGILSDLAGRDSIKGEITVIVSGASDEAPAMEIILSEIKARLSDRSCSSSTLSKEIAGKYGVSRQLIYKEILHMSGKTAGSKTLDE